MAETKREELPFELPAMVRDLERFNKEEIMAGRRNFGEPPLVLYVLWNLDDPGEPERIMDRLWASEDGEEFVVHIMARRSDEAFVGYKKWKFSQLVLRVDWDLEEGIPEALLHRLRITENGEEFILHITVRRVDKII